MDELQARLDAAGLSRTQKICLVLFYFEWKSQTEIASALGMTRQAANDHIAAAKARLVKAGLPLPKRSQHQPTVMTNIDMDKIADTEIAARW